MPITQTFTTPPTPPSSLDKTNFRTRYDNFLSYIQSLGNNLINFTTQLNSVEQNINNQASSALAAQIAAASSANFLGNWSGTTNYLTGQSVIYNGLIYRCLAQNTNQNPYSSTTWTQVSSAFARSSSNITTTPGGWYRIAQSPIGQNPVDGIFNVSWVVNGETGSVRFIASSTYGQNQCISQMSYTKYGNSGITNARIVYNSSIDGNYTYLEVMFSGSLTNVNVSTEIMDVNGWSLLPQVTVGSIPTGYASLSYAFQSSIVPGVYNKVSVNSGGIVIGGTNSLVIGNQTSLYTTNVTLTANEAGHLVLVSGGITVTLPPVNSISSGNVFIIRNIQVNPTTIAPNGNTIDIQSFKVGGGETIIIQSDGGSFYRLISRTGKTPAYDDLNSVIAYNSVYQATTDLILIVLLVGSYQNGAQIVVGNTNIPTRVLAQNGDDFATNTKYSFMNAIIPAGSYYAVQPLGASAFESITCTIYQYR